MKIILTVLILVATILIGHFCNSAKAKDLLLENLYQSVNAIDKSKYIISIDFSNKPMEERKKIITDIIKKEPSYSRHDSMMDSKILEFDKIKLLYYQNSDRSIHIENSAMVSKSNKWGMYNLSTQNLLTEIKFDNIDIIGTASYFLAKMNNTLVFLTYDPKSNEKMNALYLSGYNNVQAALKNDFANIMLFKAYKNKNFSIISVKDRMYVKSSAPIFEDDVIGLNVEKGKYVVPGGHLRPLLEEISNYVIFVKNGKKGLYTFDNGGQIIGESVYDNIYLTTKNTPFKYYYVVFYGIKDGKTTVIKSIKHKKPCTFIFDNQ